MASAGGKQRSSNAQEEKTAGRLSLRRMSEAANLLHRWVRLAQVLAR
jgi:hypothetical protein